MERLGNIGASKLNEAKAQIIKDLLNTGDYTHQEIADFFNVSRVMVTRINTGDRWNADIRDYRLKDKPTGILNVDLENNTIPQIIKEKSIKEVIIRYTDGTEIHL